MVVERHRRAEPLPDVLPHEISAPPAQRSTRGDRVPHRRASARASSNSTPPIPRRRALGK
ncbi:hypothetical protein [Amycolatopsis arida]|uniref:hypothetical protein n=1 Tax=Amycolatopsis arida TaxID=587909 RepID=UPI000B874840|nr:hypothetical protein [Amycolatopsis arida]